MLKKLFAGGTLVAAGAGGIGAALAPAQAVASSLTGGVDASGLAQAAGAAITVAGILSGQPEIALVGFLITLAAQ